MTISDGGPVQGGFTLDSAGNVYTTNYEDGSPDGSGSVNEYAPPYTGGPIASITELTDPYQLVVDGTGILLIAQPYGQPIAEDTPPLGPSSDSSNYIPIAESGPLLLTP